MAINITATGTTLTDAIRDSIEDKLSILNKYLRPEHQVHVELQEDSKHNSGQFSRVEIKITPGGYYAESHGDDFYQALDLVIPKISTQLAKAKDKKLSLRRRIGNWFKRGE